MRRVAAEATAQGLDGLWLDMQATCRPWPFRLQDIRLGPGTRAFVFQVSQGWW